MPWTKRDHPASWKNLSPKVREQAIRIGNRLVAEGKPEGQSIAIATKQAEEWGERHGVVGSMAKRRGSRRKGAPTTRRETAAARARRRTRQAAETRRRGGRRAVRRQKGGVPYHVQRQGGSWTVRASGAKRGGERFPTKQEALGAAEDLARSKRSKIVIHRADGTVQEEWQF